MRAYRDFLPTAPEELGSFVGLKTVASLDPFPKDYWGRRACAVISSYNGSADDGAKLMAQLLQSLPRPSSTGWVKCRSRLCNVVRSLLSGRSAVVLEG